MNLIEQFRTASPAHKVILTDHGFTMLPSGIEMRHLKGFQHVAGQALACGGNDYRIEASYEQGLIAAVNVVQANLTPT